MTETLESPETFQADPFDNALDGLVASAAEPVQQEAVQKAPVVKEIAQENPEIAEKKPVKVEEDLRASILDEKAEEEKVEDDKTGIEEYPPTVVSKKARENWDSMKAAHKAELSKERSQRETLEKRVKELEATGGVKSPEVSVLSKERDEWKAKFEAAEKELALDHVEKTDEYQNLVAKPGAEAEDFINTMIQTYDLDRSAINAALDEPNKIKRNEAISDIAENIRGRYNQDEFHRMTEQLIAAHKKEDELRENAKGTKEFADAKRQEEEAAKRLKAKEEYDSTLERVIEKAGSKLADIQDSWEKVTGFAKSENFDEMPTQNKAFAVLASHALAPLLSKLRSAQKELAELKSVQKARSAANATAGTGTSSAPPVNEDEDTLSRLGTFIKSAGITG